MELGFRDQHGRKVSERDWMRGIEDAVFEEAESALDERISRVRCPEHGSHPTKIHKFREGDAIRFQWEACCDALNDAVERSLR